MTTLEKLEEFVEKLRETGEGDMRSVLYVIRQLQKDPNYKINEDD